MNKSILILLNFMCFINISAQEGRLVYINQPKLDKQFEAVESNRKDSKRVEKLTKTIIDVYSSYKYNLYFNDTVALFQVEPSLSKNQFEETLQKSLSSYHTNISTSTVLEQRELGGEMFIIKKEPLEWELTDNKKIIYNYTAQEAITYVEVKNPKKEARYKITAWFTPEIPISIGPAGYNGLPGLILKLEAMGNNYEIFDIDFSVQKKDIKKPEKGKYVTEKEFKEISKEMMYKFKSFYN